MPRLPASLPAFLSVQRASAIWTDYTGCLTLGHRTFLLSCPLGTYVNIFELAIDCASILKLSKRGVPRVN